MKPFPFIGAAYTSRSVSFDGQRCVNLYLERSESGTSRGPAALYGTPGLLPWVTVGAGPIRGCVRISATQAVVCSGTGVFSVSNTGVVTAMSGAIAGSGPVYMAWNGTAVMASSEGSGYFIDPIAMTVNAIPFGGFLGSGRVDFVDGYWIWNVPGTQQFQISQLYSTTINPLDFASAEGSPDQLVSLIVNHREVWMLGENSVQVFIDTGAPDFPFESVQGAFLEIGCAAQGSVAKLDNSVFWLASDDRGFGTIVRANGYTPQRISTHAVETAIASYSVISDAIAYTYAQEGHSFYVLTFPTANRTWVYDAASGTWHERAYLNPSTGAQERHRSNCQMNFAGQTVVGDYATNNLYFLDLDTYTDNGNPIQRIRSCQHITNNDQWMFFDSLQIDMQVGVGTSTGQGVNPQVMLQWSDDGGYTWSSERWTTAGAIGRTKTRVKWRRLGKSRDRVFRAIMTDPVKVAFVNASANIRGGI